MEQSILIEIGLPIALAVIMAGMGMTLTPSDFHRVAKRPKALIWGVLAALALLPAASIGLATWMNLPAEIAVGLVIIAACPIGTTSNLISYLARGNLALSISITVLGSLTAILTLPLFVNLAIELFIDGESNIFLPALPTITMLVSIVLVPVVIGMITRVKARALAERVERAVSILGTVVLLGLIIGIGLSVADQWLEILTAAGPAVVSLGFVAIVIGLAGARILGLSPDEAITVAVGTSVRNAAIGMLVALNMMKSPEAAVPAALYGLLMYAFGFLLIGLGRRTVKLAAEPNG